MKKACQRLLLLLLVVTSSRLYADLKADLDDLQKSLVVLEDVLLQQPKTGGPLPPPPPPAGGGEIPSKAPIINIPTVPQGIASKQLGLLLKDAQVTFQFLAQEMSNFIRILDNFVKFTQGNVNPTAESAQLNDLVVLLSERYMQQHERTLEDYIKRINDIRRTVSPEDAALVYPFLDDIRIGIQKFLNYLFQNIWNTYQQNWEQVTFIYKYVSELEPYQPKSHASYHFYNKIIQSRGIGNLERIEKTLEQLLPYWKERSKTAPAQIGGETEQEEKIPWATADLYIADAYKNLKTLELVYFSKVNRLLKDFLDYIKTNKIDEDDELVNFNELADAVSAFNEKSNKLFKKLQEINSKKQLGTIDIQWVARLGKEVSKFQKELKQVANKAELAMGTNNVVFVYDNDKNNVLEHWKKLQGNFSGRYAIQLNNISKTLRSKPTTGGIELPSSPPASTEKQITSEEKNAAKEAYNIFGRLKNTINNSINPALEIFFKDIKDGSYNNDNYENVKKLFVSKVPGGSEFYVQASKLRNQLNKIQNKNAFLPGQLDEMQLIADLDSNIKGKMDAVRSWKDQTFYTKIVDIIGSLDYEVVDQILKKLEQLSEQGREELQYERNKPSWLGS